MNRPIVLGLCLAAFAAGFIFWYRGEALREAAERPVAPKLPFKTKWSPDEIFSIPEGKQIRVPFPRGFVTGVDNPDSFTLSTGKTVKLVGVTQVDAAWRSDAVALARRLVENRDVFLEYETEYKKDNAADYVYLYFRIPIIPSVPPVGPEYVHWSLNAELLKLGYAKVDETTPFKYLEKFKTYENEARAQKRGIWKVS